MRIATLGFVLVLLLAASARPALADDPRLRTPSPTMSNADLSKSCSAEASRIHNGRRTSPAGREYLKGLRRQYRRDCVSRNKQQRGSVRTLGSLGIAAFGPQA